MKIKIGSAAKAVGNTVVSALLAPAAQALADVAVKRLSKPRTPDA